MKLTASLALGLCLVASTGHAQGWASALTGFLQGYQESYWQQQNLQHGYPTQVYRPQPQPSYIILNGQTITCIPLGGGFVSCQ